MNLISVAEIVQDAILRSSRFPYDTGQLKANFVDKGSLIGTDKEASFTVLSNPLVNYGRIIEVAPIIRYRIVKSRQNGVPKYGHRPHPNRHYGYIETIIATDVVNTLEDVVGVQRDESIKRYY